MGDESTNSLERALTAPAATTTTTTARTSCSITASESAVQWMAVSGSSQLKFHASTGAVDKDWDPSSRRRRRRVEHVEHRRRRVHSQQWATGPTAAEQEFMMQWDTAARSTECFPVSGIVIGFEFTVKNSGATVTVG